MNKSNFLQWMAPLLAAACLPAAAKAPTAKKAQKSIYHKTWIDFNKNGRMDVYENPEAPTEARIQDLLSQMTMDEKTCQLVTLYGSGRVLKDMLPQDSWKNEAWKDGIANIDEEHNGNESKPTYAFPFSKHVKALHAIQRWFVEQTRLGIPVDFTNEGIRGLCHYHATYFPAQCGQGATWNKDLIARIGKAEAEEADALGYTNIYSPILGLAQDPRWGRCSETYGESPYLVAQLGKQQVLALQSQRIVSTPKHFAVYSVPVGGRDGNTRTDPHVTLHDMHSMYLEPFRVAFEEGHALGVMSSYNDYDGDPITGSRKFLTDILRHEWGFRGYVVSDSHAVEYIYDKHRVEADYEDAVARAVNAGLDVRTDFTDPADYLKPLRKAIADGKISQQTVDSRVADVLRVKFWLGLFDNPYRGDEKRADEVVHSAAHQALALEAARQSLVLLKNEKHLLPLSKSLRHIAVIGPNANERKRLIGRYGPADAAFTTFYQGICKEMPQAEVVYRKGCNIIDPHYPESELMNFPETPTEKLMMDSAVEAARQADVAILVLGGNERTVGESHSRTSLNLPGRQEELLEAVYATGKPVVLVLVNGRANSINFAQAHIPAILHAWFPGEGGAKAVAEALFGDYNPGGHLAVTFPKSVGQIPYAFPFKPGAAAKSWSKNAVSGALYPFGYGLSYTTFAFDSLRISPEQQGPQGEVQVCCRVKNSGRMAGDEVVQLYLRDEVSSLITPVKVLRGFERIHLAPGEAKDVHFTLKPHDLGLWNEDMHFVVEPGKFKVMVGASSEDIRLEGEFAIR
ncbi:MAG: glycoside hydrolase family 3 C-terminal domain-containing protein [Tannerella sp.]|nr:glycoside hydrolase family 3 C-terminal domain-containing protein [Tannerella sp.]